MALRYPYKWASAFPTPEIRKAAIAEWAERLSSLTGDDIMRGLDNWAADWPPSVDEFKRACCASKPRYGEFAPALPVPDSVKERRRAAAKKHIGLLRERLK